MVLAIASLLGFAIWSADVTQAYLASSSLLQRDVYIRNPAPDFELHQDQILKLVRPLYGLSESGDLWNGTLIQDLQEGLKMSPMRSDRLCTL